MGYSVGCVVKKYVFSFHFDPRSKWIKNILVIQSINFKLNGKQGNKTPTDNFLKRNRKSNNENRKNTETEIGKRNNPHKQFL